MEMPHASDVETYLDAFGVPYYDSVMQEIAA
jgi:hypothetical protein